MNALQRTFVTSEVASQTWLCGMDRTVSLLRSKVLETHCQANRVSGWTIWFLLVLKPKSAVLNVSGPHRIKYIYTV